MYVHKINSSSCLDFTLNKQLFRYKSVERQYIYLMDQSSPKISLATITVNGLVYLVAQTGCESASATYPAFARTHCSASYLYKWETTRYQLANKLVEGRRRSGRWRAQPALR
jgi:hypothetical protein